MIGFIAAIIVGLFLLALSWQLGVALNRLKVARIEISIGVWVQDGNWSRVDHLANANTIDGEPITCHASFETKYLTIIPAGISR